MSNDIYSVGPYTIDLDRMQLLRNGKVQPLRRQAVRVLSVLMERAGKVVSYEDLGALAWRKAAYVLTGTVIVTVYAVKNALVEYGGCIKNFPEIGYSFERPEDSDQLRVAPAKEGQKVCIVPTTFIDNTTNHNKGHLVSGIASELATALSRVRGLIVIKVHPEGIDKFLLLPSGDEFLIEGILVGTGEKLKLNVQLLTRHDRKIIWGSSYSVAGIQRSLWRITSKIVEKIKEETEAGNIKLEELTEMRPEDKVDRETYEMYLSGLHHWNRPTEINLFRAVEYFRYAISRHKTYAKAFGALSHAYGMMGFAGYIHPSIAMSQANSTARKCLELFPDSPEGLAGLAAVEGYYLWNWKESEALLKRAIALNFKYETAHHLYSMGCLMPQSRFDEALHEIRVAQQLDPLSPFIVACVGIVNFYARQYDNAIKHFEQAIKIQPRYHLAYWHRGWALAEVGQFSKAIKDLRAALEMSHGALPVLAALGQVLAGAGRSKESRRTLEQLKQSEVERYVSPYDLALVHMGLGEEEKALALLKTAVKQGVPMLARLTVHPVFDRFSSDPRFLALLRAVNLSPGKKQREKTVSQGRKLQGSEK